MKMVGPSTPKILPSLQVFSVKSSSSTLIFVKFKSLVHTLIFSHVCRLARAICRAKATLVQILKENYQPSISFKKDKNKNKIFFGSFRLHYNWCSSSHVMPVPAPVLEGHFYYDSTWNSVISADEQWEGGGGGAAADSPQLSGYLQWLEDRKIGGNSTVDGEADMNEIDKLAEMFIASCHEKFRLEKQESYRRFQEMMARSM